MRSALSEEVLGIFASVHRTIAEDLRILTRLEVAFSPRPLRDGDQRRWLGLRGPAVCVTTDLVAVDAMADASRTHLVFKSADVLALVGRVMMLSEKDLARRSSYPLEPSFLDGFREVANQMYGSANRALEALEVSARFSQRTQHLRVAQAPDATAFAPKATSSLRIIPVEIELGKLARSECVQLVNDDALNALVARAKSRAGTG